MRRHWDLLALRNQQVRGSNPRVGSNVFSLGSVTYPALSREADLAQQDERIDPDPFSIVVGSAGIISGLASAVSLHQQFVK